MTGGASTVASAALLSRRLERRGFDVALAGDGQEGLAAARAARPDLVLMDMSLPVMDGWAATRALKVTPTRTSSTGNKQNGIRETDE